MKTQNQFNKILKGIKSIKLLFIGLMFFIYNLSFAQDASSTAVTKHHYFKFQPRIKIGAGAGIKSVPNKLADHTVKTNTGPIARGDDKQDFLKSKWGPYAGVNL